MNPDQLGGSLLCIAAIILFAVLATRHGIQQRRDQR